MATLIKADGTKETIQPQNGTDFSLEELQKYVDGYIQEVCLNNQEDEILVLNEDGKDRYTTNKTATELALKPGIGLMVMWYSVKIQRFDDHHKRHNILR